MVVDAMQSLAAHGAPRRPRRRLSLVAVVAVVLVAAAVAVYFAVSPASTKASTTARHPTTGSTSSSTSSTRPTPVVSVVSISPANGASAVASDTQITVTLSGPVSANSPMPTLSPNVAGAWTRSGSIATFTPTAPFGPGTSETVTVPSGPTGMSSGSNGFLSTPSAATFSIAKMDTLRLQQLLAELGYLPVNFTQSGPEPAPAQQAVDQPGTFAWRWSTFPSDLTSLWTQGSTDIITKGAVMTFESQHGLSVDGVAGPKVWSDLLSDAVTGKMDQVSWNYAYVNKNLPETLTIYVNGNPQFANVPVNTGVPGADTANGTYPVFEHVQSSEMKGTNTDGSTYDDPNVPWASYFNGGDALHGFVRGSYGSPQSNGCVEMPIDTAGMLWGYTPVGTLVTVVGPPS